MGHHHPWQEQCQGDFLIEQELLRLVSDACVHTIHGQEVCTKVYRLNDRPYEQCQLLRHAYFQPCHTQLCFTA